MTFDHEHSRRIERELAANDFSGLLPLVAVLAVVASGIVIYQFAFNDGTTQTARAPSTIEKVAPPPAAPRIPAETTGSGAAR